ncbi:hypothetical protein UA08_07367 [Talaromyces atroroseus]|uniref:N,N-dimethylformamidase beta subunit-like C-terminal domain-containing protein n=1 Tax=Talaromyces atroroseus TaxID=1441469 RepID=A0A225A8U0_TALAT|nr:hypothetical protein UA08_07367 [Talaromyces atroroseus]OKL57211.1 hypothetical protein UA08_07367 [Talaromyces atroroseus]
MATIIEAPVDYPPEITGYAEPWIVSPGDEVAIKVSCTEPEYTHQTVRVIQGVNVAHSPRKQEELFLKGGVHSGRFQKSNPGSYAVAEKWLTAEVPSGIAITFFMQPWLPQAGHVQTVISTLDMRTKTGFSVLINQAGQMEFCIGTGDEVEVIQTDFHPERKRWVDVEFVLDQRMLSVALKPLALVAAACSVTPIALQHTLKSPLRISMDNVLLFGASTVKSPAYASDVFSGRIDRPCIKKIGLPSTTIVEYEFSLEMSSDRIIDVSGNACHGQLFNAPTRAVRGHDWDGSEPDWMKAKFGYGAIHFHDDDLDDAAWDTDFTIEIPPYARSGVYAVNVQSTNGKTSDTVSEDLWRMKRRKDVGLSLYDVHNDDSGTTFSSAKRPILNLKPGYIMWAMRRPRALSADTIMIGFLEREGIAYEVVTDHDLHERGVRALSGFNTVLTGSHPEHPSLESYNAYIAYAKQGGNVMYMGSNGFYWVCATDIHSRPHRIEIRRGDQGVRTYVMPGGEHILSLNGQQGGLWRSRGRATNVLFGIGFCGEGVALGVPFKRSEASLADASISWMFEGIEHDELIGMYRLGEGASSDEIDRFDIANGSPTCVKVLASSTGHPDDFGIAPEDVSFPIINTLGTQTDLIRSDMTYYVTDTGGGIFSVGSINWYNSLRWEDYQNNVAMLTRNVIKGFLSGLR